MKQDLLDKYHSVSKHSNYQMLAPSVIGLLGPHHLEVRSRHEAERFDWITSKMDPKGLRFLDVGGNTGYFSFELVDCGALSVDYYEGNVAHCEFVDEASRGLMVEDRLKTHGEYFGFDANGLSGAFDCVLLLNVVHHFGDDFGGRTTSFEKAKEKMMECVRVMASSTRWMVFQMGFNWKGDRSLPLFESGTKSEMVDFVRRGLGDAWDIASIGVAEQRGDRIVYADPSVANMERNDSMGEFLNRPLFLLKSRRFTC